jgi:hypothetical protein
MTYLERRDLEHPGTFATPGPQADLAGSASSASTRQIAQLPFDMFHKFPERITECACFFVVIGELGGVRVSCQYQSTAATLMSYESTLSFAGS